MNKRAYIFYLIIFVVGFSISYLCGYKMGTSDLKNVTIKSDAVKANNENKKKATGLLQKIIFCMYIKVIKKQKLLKRT